MFLNLFTSVAVNVSSWCLQFLNRAAEETTGYGEDVDYEGQHNQHLCHGKFVNFINFFFAPDYCPAKVFVMLQYFFLTLSLALPSRCFCSLSVSSSSRQSIHLAETRSRRNYTHPPPVSYLKIKSLSFVIFQPFLPCLFSVCTSRLHHITSINLTNCQCSAVLFILILL